jgi:dipeptidase D
VACHRDHVDALKGAIGSIAGTIKQEYQATDPELKVLIKNKVPVNVGQRGVTEDHTAMVVNLLTALPSGPVEMTTDFPHLVQTSANLSMVEIKNDELAVTANQRSSVPSQLDAICLAVEAVGRLAGATVETGTGYPSWPMNRESPLLKRCTALYRDLFDAQPLVQTMHAGLECGVIGDRCPGMDMISLGPTMENPHSPSERLYLPSVENVWRLMVALLESFRWEVDGI